MKNPRGTAAVKEESYLIYHCENGKGDMMMILEPENLPNDVRNTRILLHKSTDNLFYKLGGLIIRKPRILHNPTDERKV